MQEPDNEFVMHVIFCNDTLVEMRAGALIFTKDMFTLVFVAS